MAWFILDAVVRMSLSVILGPLAPMGWVVRDGC